MKIHSGKDINVNVTLFFIDIAKRISNGKKKILDVMNSCTALKDRNYFGPAPNSNEIETIFGPAQNRKPSPL